jgi:hypothetical protein
MYSRLELLFHQGQKPGTKYVITFSTLKKEFSFETSYVTVIHWLY